MLQNEQKGCCRGSRGTKDQLLIDETIFRNCRKAKRNLAIRFLQESVQHSALFLVKRDTKNGGSPDNIHQLLGQSMPNWKTVLISNEDTLGEI